MFADVQEEDVDQCDVDGDELTNNEDSLDKATHVPETVLSSREMKLGAEDEFSSLPCRRQKFQGTTGVNNNHMVAAAGGWKYATLPYRSAEPRNFMNSVFQ